MAKAIIHLDLGSAVGNARMVPARRLERGDKKAIELSIAKCVLDGISEHEGTTYANLRSNESDPPDVLCTYGDQTLGVELSELMTPLRRERDHIISELKTDILAHIRVGPRTRNRVIRVSLDDDYAKALRPGRIGAAIGELVEAHLDSLDFADRADGWPAVHRLRLPQSIASVVKSVSIEKGDLQSRSDLPSAEAPLIAFGAQHTLVVPERDVPLIVREALDKKRHSLALTTWLLLWSEDATLGSLFDAVCDELQRQASSPRMQYDRIHFLHLGFKPLLREFRWVAR